MSASFWDTFRQDLRYTVRGLRAKPAFAAAVIITLGLGIGANAAMFGIVDRMLFRPPPMLRDADHVHRIYVGTTSRGEEFVGNVGRYARYLDIQAATKSFSSVAAYSSRQMAFGVGESARELLVGTVSASFFGFFDAPPSLGRYFLPAEDSLPYGQPVVVLSHAYWSTAYDKRPDVLGQKLQIGPTVFTIIGVAPEGFAGIWPDQPPAAYIPITNYGATQSTSITFKPGTLWYRTYNWGWMSMIARRKPGVSIGQATADVTNAARQSYQNQLVQQPRSTPIALAKPRGVVGSILAERGPNQSSVAKVARWVAGVSLIVLLIACANVANLMLARALRRRREVAVRLALGVTRGRLLSQLLTESLVLAALGGIVGLVIARFGSIAMRAAMFDKSVDVPVLSDGRTILFTAAAALFVGLVTGLAPMHQTLDASRSLVGDLKSGSREGAHVKSRARVALLVIQAALSVVLLVGAGLFVRSLGKVNAARLGYDVDPVMMVGLNLRGATLDSAQNIQLRQRLLATAQATPGVDKASLSVGIPFWSSWSTSLFVAGIDTVGRLGSFNLNAVTPDYFAALGTRIVRGRGFNDADTRISPRVTVISEGMARTLWPGQEALGQCMRVGADTAPCTTVVGISEEIRQQRIAGDSALYSYYLPAPQSAQTGYGLTIRVHGKATRYTEAVRRALQHEMPGATYVTVTPFSETIGSVTKSWQMGATMFAVFGALALLLAAIGLYSVIAYNVTQRTHEVGIRVALGAQSGDVIRLVVGEGMKLSLLGLGLGAAVALMAARWVQPLLFDESPRDPAVFGIVTATLVLVALAASFLPARRAARVDPQVALRSD